MLNFILNFILMLLFGAFTIALVSAGNVFTIILALFTAYITFVTALNFFVVMSYIVSPPE